ncbi:ATP-binding protein [Emcibacter sp. SYSU 3D8]|uniref:sensor histidine kinase n=1 Tax=Emcibacter sp. SYSU 3D8 TaxID=3133969 RepID=UPI0031FF1C89
MAQGLPLIDTGQHARLPGDDDPVARWQIDVAGVRPLIGAIAAGKGEASSHVEALLARTHIVDVNQHTVHLVGSYGGRGSMVGRPVSQFWPAGSQPDLAELIAGVLADGAPDAVRTRSIKSLMLRDARLAVWRAAEAGPDTVFVAVEGSAKDPRSFWAIRASEERYRTLIHHLPYALLQVDAREIGETFERLKASGVRDLGAYLDAHPALVDFGSQVVRITEINDKAAHLFGIRDASQLIGPVTRLFDASPETARRVMIAHFNGLRSHTEVMKMRAFDGRLLDVQCSVTYPRPPEQQDVSFISLDDLTDRLRTEAQLRQLEADYSRAARIATLGELATSIAHEVNQPLAAIVTNAETTVRWLSREPPDLVKASQLAGRIAASGRHASEIVHRIRSMAAKHTTERLPVDINEVVEEALVFCRHDIQSRAIVLAFKPAAGLPTVTADRIQLQQVIVNLLVNSVQAIAQAAEPNGLIELRTLPGPSGEVVVVVEDNGPGIPDANLDRIFVGFYTTKEEGIGIGLSLCQSIAAAHGGGITAYNRPNGGARFRLWLPRDGVPVTAPPEAAP